MNEDVLNRLLRRGLQNGAVSFELVDATVDHLLAEGSQELPDSIRLNIQKKLQMRRQDAALRASSASLRESFASLGQLIMAIRTEARVERAEVAERLGKPDEYLRQIEEDARAIPGATPEEFAGLMEIFHLTLSRVSETIGRATESLFGNTLTRPTAVTTGLQPDKESAARRKSGAPNVPSALKEAADVWLRNLQMELHKRNRTDLLR